MKSLLFFLLLAFSAAAQTPKHPIDVAYEKCNSTWQNDPNFMGEPGPGRHCDAEALKSWNAELARMVAKVPTQRVDQANWLRQRDKHVAQMKKEYSSPGVGLTMTGMDEIRWYQIDITRKRVLELTKLAKGQPFSIPKE